MKLSIIIGFLLSSFLTSDTQSAQSKEPDETTKMIYFLKPTKSDSDALQQQRIGINTDSEKDKKETTEKKCDCCTLL